VPIFNRSLLALFAPGAVAAALLMSMGPIVRGGEKEDPALVAAQKREAAAKSVVAEYEIKDVVAKGGVSDKYGPQWNGSNPLPETETTNTSTNRLLLGLLVGGQKIRSEYQHTYLFDFLRLGGRTALYFPVVVVDRAGGKGFRPDVTPPAGIIFEGPKEPQCWPLPGFLVDPLLATFRGTEPEFTSWSVAKMARTEGTLDIEGKSCRGYVTKILPKRTRTYWMDPAQDYVIRRVQTYQEDKLADQTDIQYERRPSPEDPTFVPLEWEYHEYSPGGKVVHTITVKVTKLEINQPLSADQFEINFPAGAEILDRRDSNSYRVQASGELRQLDVNTGAELPASGEPDGAVWYRNRWLFGGAAILVVAGFLVIYLQRKNRQNSRAIP
jgi:hypothetical protein